MLAQKYLNSQSYLYAFDMISFISNLFRTERCSIGQIVPISFAVIYDAVLHRGAIFIDNMYREVYILMMIR